MVVTIESIQCLKDTPNSSYQSIKSKFLYHSNKLKGSIFTRDNLEKYLNEQIVEGSYKKGVCKNVQSQRKRVYRQKDAF